jgi:hypothetical protein
VELSDPQTPFAEAKAKSHGATVSSLFDSAMQTLGKADSLHDLPSRPTGVEH